MWQSNAARTSDYSPSLFQVRHELRFSHHIFFSCSRPQYTYNNASRPICCSAFNPSGVTHWPDTWAESVWEQQLGAVGNRQPQFLSIAGEFLVRDGQSDIKVCKASDAKSALFEKIVWWRSLWRVISEAFFGLSVLSWFDATGLLHISHFTRTFKQNLPKTKKMFSLFTVAGLSTFDLCLCGACKIRVNLLSLLGCLFHWCTETETVQANTD